MNKLSIYFFAASCFLFGCKGDPGPAGTPLTGNITGFVTLINSDGSRPHDMSGVTVTIDGTSYSATTDTNGKWIINDLSAGTYTIFFTKTGYGMTRNNNLEFAGGGTYYVGKTTLAQPPNFTLSVDPTKSLTDSNSVYVVTNVNPIKMTGYSYFLIVVGTGSDVSAADPNKYLYSYLVAFTSNSFMTKTHIYRYDLQFVGFTSGQAAYLIVYPLAYSSTSIGYSSYVDHATGRTVYTSLGTPSAVLPVTIP